MNTNLYYFTGTGNGLYIAKTIRKRIETDGNTVTLIPINTLDLSKKITISAEHIGIIFPTYDMDAPTIVKKFANQVNVSYDAYLFLYSHSSSISKGSVHTISKILSTNNINVSNTFETILPPNSAVAYVSPQKIENMLTKGKITLNRNIDMILNKTTSDKRRSSIVEDILLNTFKKFSSSVEHFMKFKVITSDDSCNGCSTCYKACPVQNIKMFDSRPIFETHCEMCFACINLCPKKALSYGKMKKKNLVSYRHPEVTLKELLYR